MYSATQRVDNLEVFKMDVSGAGLDAMKYQDHCNICIVFIFTCLWLQYEPDDISSVDAAATSNLLYEPPLVSPACWIPAVTRTHPTLTCT